MECFLDNDLTRLGTGPEVEEVWDKIYLESCRLSQNNNYNETLELMREINDLRAKITIANSCISYLQMAYDADVVAVLNSYTLRCTIQEEDRGEVIIQKLNMVVARMKKWFPMLSKAEKDLERLRLEHVDVDGRAFFEDGLDAISDSKGYHVHAKDVTVAWFYRKINRLNEKALKNQSDANRKNR